MLVWSFPNDPILAHPAEVIDPNKVTQCLPYQRLPQRSDKAQSIFVSETEVVNYRPEERCIVRYRLQSKSFGQPATVTIFGKTYKDQIGKQEQARIDHFWQAYLKDESGIIVARPLGYTSSVKTVWQAELEGRSVLETIDHSNHEYFARAIASGLATVHKSAPPDLANKTDEDHITEIRNLFDYILLENPLPPALDFLSSFVHREPLVPLLFISGSIVEHGYHDQLLSLNGYDTQLFKSQHQLGLGSTSNRRATRLTGP